MKGERRAGGGAPGLGSGARPAARPAFARALITEHVLWFVFVGLLTAGMGLLGPALKRYWVSAPQAYLLAGAAVGPAGLGLLDLQWVPDAKLLEVLSEIAVIVSLYAAGMKMRLAVFDRRWATPAMLAFVTMAVSVALITGAGYLVLGLPLAGAALLAATLAPTDPVLADEVQLENAGDDDRLRRALTGEAGLNDGTAFPLVLLAVGLLDASLHPLGEFLWRWAAVDLVWKIAGGLAFGYLAGRLLGRAAVAGRERLGVGAGGEELLSLGLVALTYGLALFIHTYAFLAVFAAAVALRKLEMDRADAQTPAAPGDPDADDPADGDAPAEELVREQTRVADVLERVVQLFLAVTIGALLTVDRLTDPKNWLFAAAAILLVRPLAVYLTTWPCDLTGPQRRLTAWFGIRGIGTVYYLSHAFTLGVADEYTDLAASLSDAALVTIAASVLLHGSSVTPLMSWYERRHEDEPAPDADHAPD